MNFQSENDVYSITPSVILRGDRCSMYNLQEYVNYSEEHKMKI